MMAEEVAEVGSLMEVIKEWYSEQQSTVNIRKIELTDENNEYLGKIEMEDEMPFFYPSKT